MSHKKKKKKTEKKQEKNEHIVRWTTLSASKHK
jgi:hypothetical protein